jgi:hypothetical protein
MDLNPLYFITRVQFSHVKRPLKHNNKSYKVFIGRADSVESRTISVVALVDSNCNTTSVLASKFSCLFRHTSKNT